MISTRAPRPFTGVDALTLVLATVLGLAMTNAVLAGQDEARRMMGDLFVVRGFRRWGYASVPLFVSWSLAVLALRLRARPRRRRMRGPGVVSGLVVAMLAARDAARPFAYQFRHNGTRGLRLFGPYGLLGAVPSWLVLVSHTAGFAVAVTWIALRAGRWWHPEPSWTDRAGRALGWYWVAMFLAHSYYTLAS